MKPVTVSAKIPKDLREKLERHGVKVSEVVRRALEEEVRVLESRMLMKRLDEISDEIRGKISTEDVTKAVRAGREGR